jgi:hypothetical protein
MECFSLAPDNPFAFGSGFVARSARSERAIPGLSPHVHRAARAKAATAGETFGRQCSSRPKIGERLLW